MINLYIPCIDLLSLASRFKPCFPAHVLADASRVCGSHNPSICIRYSQPTVTRVGSLHPNNMFSERSYIVAAECLSGLLYVPGSLVQNEVKLVSNVSSG